MFQSLYSKLAVVLTILFCLVGLIFLVVTLFSTEMYQKEVSQRLNIELPEHIVSEDLLIKENRVNREALEEIFHMMMVINPSIEIYLIDPDGKILAYSAPQDKVKREKVDVAPIQELLRGKTQIPILGDDPRDPSGKKIFSATRISEQGRLEGYLYVILGGQAYDSVVQKLKGSYILQLSGWMIGASLLFALAAGLILFALLTKRLKRLSKVMGDYNVAEPMELGLLPTPSAHGKGDEIDRLSSTFKGMAEQIQDQMNKLRESDNLRRELVANVSHDLRTPLSTLQGYVETLLLKEKELSEDEKKTYLETAVKHCKRLGSLVSELLELAKLDSDQIKLQYEMFNLSELVQDVILKFQLKANEKGVRLSPFTRTDIPFVRGDIGLIERVFENLIENAIHYTPQGGSVEVKLVPDSDRIFVQIKDSGSGIPEGELPHIFQRFHRSDQTHEQDSGHSGLGLSIAKKILELHQSMIEVQSRLNSGTTISFHLDAYNSPQQPSPA